MAAVLGVDEEEVELLLGLLEQRQGQELGSQGNNNSLGGIYLYNRSIYLPLSAELLEDLSRQVKVLGKATAEELEGCLQARLEALGIDLPPS